ncbi:MAG: aminoacetone oxidase family FAD-binding enzyme [Lachnospiraceae bacterium]|nr:aminoacetone oxidase family FAD-binding enzyme [Lachnospiraceae bacterium]
MSKRIAIIGAGASGMVAAIKAAGAGAAVTLLEKNDRVGKKILQTGNGRCNYTNLNMNSSFFRSGGREKGFEGFVSSVLSRFSERDTIAFFEGLGIRPKDKNGYVYPYPEAASAILDALRMEIGRLPIRLLTESPVTGVEKRGKAFSLGIEGKRLREDFDAVIVATGGLAAPKTGSTGDGYGIAGDFGIRVVPPLPALTFIHSRDACFRSLAGIRAEAGLRLLQDGRVLDESRGELQLTEKGLSGICSFQLSGRIARLLSEGKHCEVRINFLPDLDWQACFNYLRERQAAFGQRKAEEFFIGVFHKKLGQALLKRCGIGLQAQVSELKERDLHRLCDEIHSFKVEAEGTGDFQRAQVTSGGIALSELDSSLMASRVPGLYFIGEAVDVDGICGGYNLQWAWASGAIAGEAAGKEGQ